MKNLIYLLLAVFILSSCNDIDDPIPPLSLADSISMGAGYADEVFYSLENGVLKTSPRSSWDIAFSTDPMSSTILVNEGYGIELYTYPSGDQAAWDDVDTTGISDWPLMYNSDTSWYHFRNPLADSSSSQKSIAMLLRFSGLPYHLHRDL